VKIGSLWFKDSLGIKLSRHFLKELGIVAHAPAMKEVE
jgi:hypothetical protein